MRTRICSDCGVEKFAEEFHREPRKPVGLAACCRMCLKERRKGKHKKRSSAIEPPEKAKARKAVKSAVRRGLLVKPNACEVCGTILPHRLLQGHHVDYEKPLEVMWLCSSCHGIEHMDENAVRAELRRLRMQQRNAA